MSESNRDYRINWLWDMLDAAENDVQNWPRGMRRDPQRNGQTKADERDHFAENSATDTGGESTNS